MSRKIVAARVHGRWVALQRDPYTVAVLSSDRTQRHTSTVRVYEGQEHLSWLFEGEYERFTTLSLLREVYPKAARMRSLDTDQTRISGQYACHLTRDLWWLVEVCADTNTVSTPLVRVGCTDADYDHVEGCDLAAVRQLRAAWTGARPVWRSLEALRVDYPRAKRWPEADTFA